MANLLINVSDITVTTEILGTLEIYFLSTEYLTFPLYPALSISFVVPSATVINVIVE